MQSLQAASMHSPSGTASIGCGARALCHSGVFSYQEVPASLGGSYATSAFLGIWAGDVKGNHLSALPCGLS